VLPASEKLSPAQMSMLRHLGEVRPTVAGEVLFREGDRSYDFVVILSGRVKIVDHQTGVERVLVTGGPAEFVAELSLLTGERLFTTAVVAEPGSVLVVALARLQALISRDEELGSLILRAALARRQWLAESGTGLRIVGSRSSPETVRLLEFSRRNRLPHVWLNVDDNPEAAAVLAHHSVPPDQTPVVVMRGGDLLRHPSNVELARAAGIGSGPAPGVTYDVAIVGAGPAGLAAAVYGASEGLSTAVVDQLAVGGQIATTSKIENYLGFPVGVSGVEFAQRAFLQVLRFGASVVLPATAVRLSGEAGLRVIQLDTGDAISARSVVVASGVSYRKLDAAGLDSLNESGVYYTPLVANEALVDGEPAVIVGGGNSAGQAATALADSGNPVTIVIRGPDLAATMSQYLIDRIAQSPAVTVRDRCVIKEVGGAGSLEWVRIQSLADSGYEMLPAKALFILAGAEPHTQWLQGSARLDKSGFVVTGSALGMGIRHKPPWTELDRDPYLLETSLPGVFAAGDVRSGSVKRAAAAVGEGSIAIRFVSEHLGRRATATTT
jgi:thioredoxin reductase (NADPH)